MLSGRRKIRLYILAKKRGGVSGSGVTRRPSPQIRKGGRETFPPQRTRVFDSEKVNTDQHRGAKHSRGVVENKKNPILTKKIHMKGGGLAIKGRTLRHI